MLEPGAGSGNIIKTLQKYGDFSIDAVEIRPEEAQHLQDLGVNVIIDDFLSMDLGKKYDLIIGNPPFNQAIEFVEKCLGLLKPGGRLIFLLRTAFMESDQRFEFWQQEDHRLAGLYTLMRHADYLASPYRGIYVTIGRWANQPGLYRNLSLNQFIDKATEAGEKAPAKYREELLKDFPELAKYFERIYEKEARP